MDDLISRQGAIDVAKEELDNGTFYDIPSKIESLPSAQSEPSEITDEQAILYLQSTGWMQNHDREMYEMGLKEQLADDSDSYDSLVPSAQSEITQEDVELYCRQRCLTVITNELFAEMKARWSAQPEQKKGKWIVHPEVKNVYGGTYIECSQCGEKYVVQHMEDEKYCRNCGAKMEE